MSRRLFYLFFLFIFMIGFVFHPRFSIQEINVSGYYFVPEQAIQHMSSPLIGKNIMSRFFAKRLLDRIQATYPEIESVSISMDWPSTIQLDINEKKPWAAFLGLQKTRLVSEDGTILTHYRQGELMPDQNGLMIIKGVDGTQFESRYIPDHLHMSISVLIHNLKDRFPGEFLQVEKQGDFEYILYKNDSLPVKLGDLDFLELKLNNLTNVLSHFYDTIDSIEYIDLRLEDRIVLKFRGKPVLKS